MSLLAVIRIAFRALRVNKTRSILTMLGVIIGVAAVIAMVAIGSGATKRVQDQIASIGSNVIVVLSGSITQGGMRMGSGNAMTLTEDDAKAIQEECAAVEIAAPNVRRGGQVVYGNNNWGTQLQGVTPEMLEIRSYTIVSGRAMTHQDVDGSAKICLVGRTVVNNLFDGADPVDQVIRIRNVPITVVGVLSPKGQSPSGEDQDDTILLPISTAKKKVFGFNQAQAGSVGAIQVQAKPGKTVEAQEEMTELLRQRHRIQPGADDDFSVRNLEEVFKAQETSANVMSILLASIASVSLIVGGIGIMNIMLVSVFERTREIGLRMAIGAKTNDILTQFLVEAVTLSVVGGIIGILLGLGASWIISRVAGWSTVVSMGSIGLAFTFSGLVGIFFGYYPARKAAYLDPIEALRFE